MAAQTADASRVWDVINGYTRYWSVVTGVELGVFDALADGPLEVTTLAQRCGAEPRRLAVLADALVAAGLLDGTPSVYALSATAEAHLVHGRDRSMCDLLAWSPGPQENWPALAGTVRGALPPAPVDDDAAFYARLAAATRPSQLAVARAALGALDLPSRARVLELGAGAAPWAAALLGADPAASAVVNDFAGVVEHAEHLLGELSARCRFVAGDYLDAQLPAGPYDLVVLAHVLRAEPDDRAAALVARAASLLSEDGRLVVAEYLGGRDPRVHPHAALLGVTMLAATRHGRLCTVEELSAWLAAAGCSVVAHLDPLANTDVVVAAPAASQ